VYRFAIAANAPRIALAHNHPSGDSTPSTADVALTRRVRDAGQILGVALLDHLVCGESTYTSFADTGRL